MNGQEFATAVQYGLPIVVVLIDNGIYGTIRMHQEREFPGRAIASNLRNPDFAAYARAFGGHGETVEETARIPARVRARARLGPALDHPREDRPGSDHADDDAERNPRGRARRGAPDREAGAGCPARLRPRSSSRPARPRPDSRQGVTGFAFSIVALSFWAWALPPETAAPLAVFGALIGQIASLASVRGGFEWPKIVPLVVGGGIGVPIGVFLLHNADPQSFRLAVGVLLTSYSLFGLLVRDPGASSAADAGSTASLG